MQECTIGIGSEFGWFHLGLQRTRVNDAIVGNRYQTFSNGRAALRQAIKVALAKASPDEDTFLLPAYLCHSMVQPFVEEGVKFEFYPVTEKLTVDLASLVRLINSRTLGILLVHYFGYCQPKPVIEWLQQRELFIIEDSTHSWLSSSERYGDVTVVSPRKMLPVPDLAWLTLNNRRAQSGSKIVPVPKGVDWRFAVSRSLALTIRGLYFRWPANRVKQLAFSFFHYADNCLDERILVRRSSRLARELFRRFPLRQYAEVRRKNFRFILEGFSEISCIHPLFAELPEEVVPLGFPVLTDKRDWVKAQLIEAGIYPPVHWLLPTEIDLQQFPISAEISSKILTIPIDQRYGERHMQYVLDRLQQIDCTLRNNRI